MQVCTVHSQSSVKTSASRGTASSLSQMLNDVLTGNKLPSALPTFLGSMQGEGLDVEEEEERSEGVGQEGGPDELTAICSSQDQAMMQDCYSKIVEKLSLANPTMVLQVGHGDGDVFVCLLTPNVVV